MKTEMYWTIRQLDFNFFNVMLLSRVTVTDKFYPEYMIIISMSSVSLKIGMAVNYSVE